VVTRKPRKRVRYGIRRTEEARRVPEYKLYTPSSAYLQSCYRSSRDTLLLLHSRIYHGQRWYRRHLAQLQGTIPPTEEAMELLYPLLLLRPHRGGEDRSFNQVWKSPSAVGLCSSLYLNMTSCADEKTLDPSRDIMGISNLLHLSSTPRRGPGLPPMNVKTRTKSWKKETNPADHGTKSKSRAIRIRINLENGPIGAQGGNHRLHQLSSLRIQIHSA